MKKTRIQLQDAQSAVRRKCVSCLGTIEPYTEFYSDLDSDDDVCVKCGNDFVNINFAVVVP
jgi:hypothetical protein